MRDLIHRFEHGVFYILSAVLMIYITVEIIELIYQFFASIWESSANDDRLLVTKEQTNRVLPVFFNILIAIELIDTFNVYIKEQSLKVQSILLIGLIALGRKLIVLDIGHADGMSNLGLAAIIIALAAGYYLVKRPELHKSNNSTNDPS